MRRPARNLYGLGAGSLRRAMYRPAGNGAKRYITRRTVQSPWTKKQALECGGGGGPLKGREKDATKQDDVVEFPGRDLPCSIRMNTAT
ncbi:hypothetical protein ColLi_13723 [Colletotrichum liriopes]|uniref:Uncharacterized protein n=1 Tax=Colletotrichum liriopes TaxID=708192 RepID=A0AA37H244_9PEZI|nr:hypothetical protein ColLi_13723 [Colletotrichum liriopes]